jgi:magnesium chelatase subunit I
MEVVEQEARPVTADGLHVSVPGFMAEVVAEISQQARRSPHVNQRSGVSVRLSITNYETLVANATRRAVHSGEQEVVPRVSDLEALVASTAGKLEFETVEDGREEQVLDRIVKAAMLDTFRARCRPEKLTQVVAAFENGLVVNAGADVASAEYAKLLPKLPGLRDTLTDLEVGETPAGVASALEFVLEGLHLSKRLNKDAVGARATYRGRG